MKKVISILVMSIVLTFGLTIAVNAAESGTCGENAEWTLDDNGTLTISGSGAMSNYSYWGPTAPWYNRRFSVKEVVIENGITSIGEEAFSGCSAMTSVTIPDSVTSIGQSAFFDCGSLTSIDIPNSVTSIGGSAFSSCGGLTSITIPESVTFIGSGVFNNCDNLTEIHISSLEAWFKIDFKESICYGRDLYINGEILTCVTIPDGITEIKDYAFESWTFLEEVNIPEGVTAIGDGAFSGCSSLKSLTIPTSITSIGERAFSGCDSLESITLPDGITSVDHGAFSECSGLKNIVIPESVTSIGDSAFSYCKNLESITISDGVTSIGKNVFAECDSLTDVTIGSGVTSIGDNAFANCYSIENLYISNLKAWCEIDFNYESIQSGYYSALNTSNPMYFANNVYINGELVASSVAIPEGVNSIGSYALLGCDAVSITIPEGVTSIGSGAFAYCNNLESITLPDSVTSIGYNAFSSCYNMTDVYISSIDMWFNISFDNEYSNPMSWADNMYINGELATSVTVPDGVTEIVNQFYGWNSLEQVRLPDSVTYIGDAFSGCNISSLIMTSSVESINGSFLKGNVFVVYYQGTEEDWNNIYFGYDYGEDITAIVLYNGDPDVETVVKSGSLGENVTFELTNYGNVTITGTGDMDAHLSGNPLYTYKGFVKSVVIENGVTSIGGSAFYGCEALTSVTIPESVTSIGYDAFWNCSSLRRIYIPKSVTKMIEGYGIFDYANPLIYYGGSKTDWQNIDGSDGITLTVFYNQDGLPEPLTSLSVTKNETETEWVFDVELEKAKENSFVYAGVYDESGALIAIKQVPLSMTENTIITQNKLENAESIKIFVWNNMFNPITMAKEVEL